MFDPEIPMGAKKLDLKFMCLDVDGTLIDRETGELLPGVKKALKRSKVDSFAFITNQGGVGLRYWMESGGFGDPSKLPTQRFIEERLYNLREQVEKITGKKFRVYVCYAYQSKKSGEWSPTPEGLDEYEARYWRHNWRKPSGSMIGQAMREAGALPENTTMIGDRSEDRQAADHAGVKFIDAAEWRSSPNLGGAPVGNSNASRGGHTAKMRMYFGDAGQVGLVNEWVDTELRAETLHRIALKRAAKWNRIFELCAQKAVYVCPEETIVYQKRQAELLANAEFVKEGLPTIRLEKGKFWRGKKLVEWPIGRN